MHRRAHIRFFLLALTEVGFPYNKEIPDIKNSCVLCNKYSEWVLNEKISFPLLRL